MKPLLITLACIVTLGLSVSARADQWNKTTDVTFSGPVEIPGKVLTPGTYVFKLLNNSSDRNIVEIFNKDQTQLYATIMGITDYRLTPTGHTVINFEEEPAGNPEAIKDWFYPGSEYGVQFVYPHDQAVRIAKRTHQNVLSMDNSMQHNISAPVKSANDASVRAMENTPVNGVDQNGNQIDSSQITSRQR